MNCKKCGLILSDGDKFCQGCGSLVENNNLGNVDNNQSLNNNTNNFNMENKQEVVQNVNNQPQPTYNQPVNNEPVQPMYNQPINNEPVQPMYNQPGNNEPVQPMYNQPKPNNNLMLPIIIGIVVVFITILVGIFIFSSNENSEKIESGYKLNLNNFTLNIPSDYLYVSHSANTILIYDEEETWMVVLEIMEGSYKAAKKNMNQLKSIYESEGFKSSNAIEKKYSGKPIITWELVESVDNYVIGLSEANSMYLFAFTILNETNTFDYQILDNIAPIFKTATYNNTGGMNIGTKKVDMSVISEIAK